MSTNSFHKKKKSKPSLQKLIEGIRAGDLQSVAYGITLCESKKRDDRAAANELISVLLKNKKSSSIRIGITGVPGVGKSTFIESFGLHLINQHQKKLAVLAIDPSSEKSKGSILGDKTRMEELSRHKDAFIRPSPSSGAYGGVGNQTRESIIICEAAGFDVIFIETVGVGQSETEVRQMCDFFLLLMLAGAGDELQGIKRGIMEMADAILINKADGQNEKTAKLARRAYQNALHLFPESESKWQAQVQTCSALNNSGMAEAWDIIQQYIKQCSASGYFEKQRQKQLISWFKKSIRFHLESRLLDQSELKKKQEDLIQTIMIDGLSPLLAADQMIEAALNHYARNSNDS